MIICNTDPRYCDQFNRVFNYMYNYSPGECGVVDGNWCVTGNSYVVGDLETYGYCALQI